MALQLQRLPVTLGGRYCRGMVLELVGQCLRCVVKHELPVSDSGAGRSRRRRRLRTVGSASHSHHIPNRRYLSITQTQVGEVERQNEDEAEKQNETRDEGERRVRKASCAYLCTLAGIAVHVPERPLLDERGGYLLEQVETLPTHILAVLDVVVDQHCDGKQKRPAIGTADRAMNEQRCR